MKIKEKLSILLIIIFAFLACSEDADIELKKVNITLKFTHNWDGIPVNSSDFAELKFTNANQEKLSIERLRYLISAIKLGNNTTSHHLIDIGEDSGLALIIENVYIGTHPLSFTFGLTNTDNIDGAYKDLNSVSFNVPKMLGGGYHFMQFDGKYLDANNAESNFNYHTIRAVNISDSDNFIIEDTSFLVDLGDLNLTNDASIEIKMNIAEWFKNPNTWNLNELNTFLMQNFEAQKMMSANGKSVFSLGEIVEIIVD